MKPKQKKLRINAIILCIIFLLCAIFHLIFFIIYAFGALVNFKVVYIIFILIILFNATLFTIFYFKSVADEKNKRDLREALMNQLNSREFKEIRLNDEEKNILCYDKIWAKVSDNNEKVIIVKIQYIDDNEKEGTNEILFNKKEFQSYIEEVIE